MIDNPIKVSDDVKYILKEHHPYSGTSPSPITLLSDSHLELNVDLSRGSVTVGLSDMHNEHAVSFHESLESAQARVLELFKEAWERPHNRDQTTIDRWLRHHPYLATNDEFKRCTSAEAEAARHEKMLRELKLELEAVEDRVMRDGATIKDLKQRIKEANRKTKAGPGKKGHQRN